ncbi:MAG TPA: hypothetical protein VI341_02080, partial [Actinomycetota bacterium]
DTDRHAEELAARASAHLRIAGSGSMDRGDIPATVNLLTRAASLMDSDEPAIVPVLLDLAMAVAEAGDVNDALTTAERAEEIARAGSDDVLAARAQLYGCFLGYWGHHGDESMTASDELAKTSLALFQRAGDLAGEAIAWTIIGSTSWGRCQAGEADPAWRRAVDLFDAVGDRRMADEYRSWLSSVQVWGPTPCDEALRNLHEAADSIGDRPMAQMGITSSIATIKLMLGELDEARVVFEDTDRELRERGRRLVRAHSSQEMGYLELMSGHEEESARILGEGEAELRTMGSDAATIISSMYARALYGCGRYDEADEAASRAITGSRFAASEEALARSVRGMVAARRGSFEEGERFVREAIAIIDQSDFLCDRADARVALAEVLELAGRRDEAADAAREAIALYGRKGNVLQAGHARERLSSLEP